MNIKVHNQILWRACVLAHHRFSLQQDPREFYPLLVRGSWLCDVNQASIAIEPVDTLDADRDVRDGIQQFWSGEAKDLIKAMETSADPDMRAASKAAREKFENGPSNQIEDFGRYNRFDHFDILQEKDAIKELKSMSSTNNKPVVGETIRDTRNYVIGNLQLANNANRFDWANITTLGRSLHLVGDFFAHTNYVELLLWALSRQPQPAGLDPTVLGVFNGEDFDPGKPWNTICPLPAHGEVDKCLEEGGELFWYGPSPEATPLVSSVFDSTDTVCTLLGMYVGQLERMDKWAADGTGPTKDEVKKRNDLLDAAMAYLAFSPIGDSLVRNGCKLFYAMSDGVRALGNRVRGHLAKMLRARSTKIGGTKGKVLDLASVLVTSYDATILNDQANAGYYDGIVRILMQDALEDQKKERKKGSFFLPHHTLLRKDWFPDRPCDRIRFNMACTLAAEASAQLLSWYFGNAPQQKRAEDLIFHFLRHPCNQARDEATNKALSQLVASLNGQEWHKSQHPVSLVVMNG